MCQLDKIYKKVIEYCAISALLDIEYTYSQQHKNQYNIEQLVEKSALNLVQMMGLHLVA